MAGEIQNAVQHAARPEYELVIRYIIYPLVAGLVGTVIALYHRDLKTTKKTIVELKKEHDEDLLRLRDECKEKVADLKENIRELFSERNNLRKDISELQNKVSVRDKECEINHRWNGTERRE